MCTVYTHLVFYVIDSTRFSRTAMAKKQRRSTSYIIIGLGSSESTSLQRDDQRNVFVCLPTIYAYAVVAINNSNLRDLNGETSEMVSLPSIGTYIEHTCFSKSKLSQVIFHSTLSVYREKLFPPFDDDARSYCCSFQNNLIGKSAQSLNSLCFT